MAAEKQPEIQLIANLVVQRPDGKVLLVRYDAEDERWWLPGEDLDPISTQTSEQGRFWTSSPGSRPSTRR